MSKDFPELAKLGGWYCSIPSSNFIVERLFAKLRAKDGPLRRRMTVKTLGEEVAADNNRPYLLEMLMSFERANSALWDP